MNPPPSAAEQNLAVIRTLMERAAVYRRALGPILVAVGALGVVAAIAGILLGIESSRSFLVYWLAVAVVALAAAFMLSRRQALREREPFWSAPTRCMALALAPPLLLGALLTCLAWHLPPSGQALVWLALYGAALHAAGAVAPAGLRYLGWLLMLVAAAKVGLIAVGLVHPGRPGDAAFTHILMGATFGLAHLAYGVYLVWTKRPPSSP